MAVGVLALKVVAILTHTEHLDDVLTAITIVGIFINDQHLQAEMLLHFIGAQGEGIEGAESTTTIMACMVKARSQRPHNAKVCPVGDGPVGGGQEVAHSVANSGDRLDRTIAEPIWNFCR